MGRTTGSRHYPPRMSEVRLSEDAISQGSDRAIPAKWRVMALGVTSLVLGLAGGGPVARPTAGGACPGHGGALDVSTGPARALWRVAGFRRRGHEGGHNARAVSKWGCGGRADSGLPAA